MKGNPIMSTPKSTAFSARRFWLLARTHWRSNWRHHLIWLTVATFIALLLLTFFWVAVLENRPIRFTTGQQAGWYFFGLLIFGPVFASQHFGPMRQKAHAQMMLMLPASLWEKSALAALNLLVAFPLVYTLWFSLLAYPVAELSLAWDTHLESIRSSAEGPHRSEPVNPANYALFSPVWSFEKAHVQLHLIYAALTGFSTATSLLFKQSPGLRTVLLSVFLFLCTLAITLAANEARSLPSKVLFTEFDESVVLSAAPVFWVNVGFWLCVPMLLWLSVFRALRERDLS